MIIDGLQRKKEDLDAERETFSVRSARAHVTGQLYAPPL
jgi:hypothetical protein